MTVPGLTDGAGELLMRRVGSAVSFWARPSQFAHSRNFRRQRTAR
jgi:hypothetical protein